MEKILQNDGVVKIKIKENGSIIKIHTVYRTIQPNNPATYMGKIDVYIYPFFCCKQYDGGDTFIGIYTSYTIYTVIDNKHTLENNGVSTLISKKICHNDNT